MQASCSHVSSIEEKCHACESWCKLLEGDHSHALSSCMATLTMRRCCCLCKFLHQCLADADPGISLLPSYHCTVLVSQLQSLQCKHPADLSPDIYLEQICCKTKCRDFALLRRHKMCPKHLCGVPKAVLCCTWGKWSPAQSLLLSPSVGWTNTLSAQEPRCPASSTCRAQVPCWDTGDVEGSISEMTPLIPASDLIATSMRMLCGSDCVLGKALSASCSTARQLDVTHP